MNRRLHWVLFNGRRLIADRLVHVQLPGGDCALRYLGEVADSGERLTMADPDDRDTWWTGVVTRVVSDHVDEIAADFAPLKKALAAHGATLEQLQKSNPNT